MKRRSTLLSGNSKPKMQYHYPHQIVSEERKDRNQNSHTQLLPGKTGTPSENWQDLLLNPARQRV